MNYPAVERLNGPDIVMLWPDRASPIGVALFSSLTRRFIIVEIRSRIFFISSKTLPSSSLKIPGFHGTQLFEAYVVCNRLSPTAEAVTYMTAHLMSSDVVVARASRPTKSLTLMNHQRTSPFVLSSIPLAPLSPL